MKPANDESVSVDERVERLICRQLDGELTAVEQAELDRILATDPAARDLFNDYHRNDVLAAQALRTDINAASATMTIKRPNRGFWIGAAGAVLTAAAVVALSFLVEFSSPNHRSETARNTARSPMVDDGYFVDYRDVDYQPKQRWDNVCRDLIGVRGDDPNVIYIFERESHSTKVAPLTGEF